MATIILNHRVNNFASWKTLYDSDLDRRTAAGLTQLAIGEKSGDPGNVFIIFHATDASIVQHMMSDPELQKRMQEGGVISAPEVTVID